MSTPSVTAAYSISTPSQDTTTVTETTGTSEPILSFTAPIDSSYNASASPNQLQKEQYLSALAKALSVLQESINTGLTERLVQQGVLEDKGDNPVDVKNKVRTKVPGQPNNSKKGQTKKQQQREQQEQKDKESAVAAVSSSTELSQGAKTTTATPGAEDITLSFTNTSAPDTSSAMDIDSTPSSNDQTATSTDALELEDQYKPKGGIYGSDDEDDDAAAKDEVDLVMEADPGEIDGACLELPKEQDAFTTAPSQTKKRNELPVELTGEEAAATKKSRGSEA
ncbi:hypothetical protein BGZ97_006170 [Linnemannia gamsii]|jgi:hypothetical protein|uniref:EKC/KEOPS complex subunit GON7 n=1 Tax=Linnemannia gamsii TaxID=64522 RepID=A0A9P6UFQ1_9FUNG|nr:hypothetical protein BGZ97_006170 [Linnemannia gamsii]